MQLLQLHIIYFVTKSVEMEDYFNKHLRKPREKLAVYPQVNGGNILK